jgi:predicted dehydrogenase
MDEFAGDLSRGDQIKRYTDYREMCRDPEIDAIFVGTPNQLHVPVALEAVRRDKHVMVTKPLADGERPATKLVKAAEAAGVVNMMSLSTRFNPQNRYLQDKAREGYFGEIYYARSRSVRRNGIPAWHPARGGAFRDMGVHFLDAAWAIMGHPRPVTVSGVGGGFSVSVGKVIRDRRQRRCGASSIQTISPAVSFGSRMVQVFRLKVSGLRINRQRHRSNYSELTRGLV